MDCHIKIGQLEFWVTPLGVCDCDPALGAAHALDMEPTCVSTHRQLETAAFLQLITKSPCSASSKRNTENVTYPWHCLHTQERGGGPSKEFQAIIFISQSELGPWPVSPLSLPTHNWLCHCFIPAAPDPYQPYPISRYYCILVDLCTWDLALLMLAPNEGGENKLIYASGAISLASLACLLTAFVILIFKQ